jgi:hypothetical protein
MTPNTPASLGVERRVWVRYACDLESKCHSQKGTDELSWSARVRDISRGGLNIQLNRYFEPGTLLTVDVPLGPDLVNRALVVRVVHALNFGPTNWSLGCAFEKPLEEEDLLAFQAKKTAFSSDDKRAWIRFACDEKRPPQATVLINPNNKILARVVNISPGGIGLGTQRHCEPGTPLRLELVDAAGRTSRPIQARVVHSTSKGPEDWLIGCSFDTPLTEEDVAPFL